MTTWEDQARSLIADTAVRTVLVHQAIREIIEEMNNESLTQGQE